MEKNDVKSERSQLKNVWSKEMLSQTISFVEGNDVNIQITGMNKKLKRVTDMMQHYQNESFFRKNEDHNIIISSIWERLCTSSSQTFIHDLMIRMDWAQAVMKLILLDFWYSCKVFLSKILLKGHIYQRQSTYISQTVALLQD